MRSSVSSWSPTCRFSILPYSSPVLTVIVPAGLGCCCFFSAPAHTCPLTGRCLTTLTTCGTLPLHPLGSPLLPDVARLPPAGPFFSLPLGAECSLGPPRSASLSPPAFRASHLVGTFAALRHLRVLIHSPFQAARRLSLGSSAASTSLCSAHLTPPMPSFGFVLRSRLRASSLGLGGIGFPLLTE